MSYCRDAAPHMKAREASNCVWALGAVGSHAGLQQLTPGVLAPLLLRLRAEMDEGWTNGQDLVNAIGGLAHLQHRDEVCMCVGGSNGLAGALAALGRGVCGGGRGGEGAG